MNIVFDLGGVVFRWDPGAIARRVFDDRETQELVVGEIFGHEDWAALDRGILDHDQAVLQGMSRTGLPRHDIELLLSEVPKSLAPIPGMFELIQHTKHAGNSLYVLSNMQFSSIEHLEATHDIWHLFDGRIISCRIGKIKPEREIYEYLLREHGLAATDTVFIDDMPENLAAASQLGIRTVQFVDAVRCRAELLKLGVIPG